MTDAPRKSPAHNKTDSSWRRQPLQTRSQHTVDTIFKATAQLLSKEGPQALSTDRVAARSGFSVGTLYQYFPSKEKLVWAMACRGQAMLLTAIDKYFVELENDPNTRTSDPVQLLRNIVRFFLKGFSAGKDPIQGEGFTAALIRLAWTWENLEDTAHMVRQMAERITIFMERIDHPSFAHPTSAHMFVLTRAVMGVARSASLERSPLLGSNALENVMVQMVSGIIYRPPTPQP